MKKLITFFVFFLFTATIFANGVGVVNASEQVYLKLLSSAVNVNVENQVAVIKSTQIFKNNLTYNTAFKYAFPLPEEASAIGLRWFIEGKWHDAVISATPQDTTFPGGGEPNQNFLNYIGQTPLYFDFSKPLPADSSILIELTYVEFLKYKFGKVQFEYPNDYTAIQTDVLNKQEFTFDLSSSRTIENIQLQNINADSLFNKGNSAFLSKTIYESQASYNYQVSYQLSLNQLGLFSFSTFQPDTTVPDDLGNGFFVFVAEPDPSQNTKVINKVFTLIIDRSGSMYGEKMDQAKNAADFIVNNLNEGDKFNIVDFSDNISSFQNEHVIYNSENRDAALNYINTLNADGLTNISGAFDTAVPQFSTSNDSTANIIIFFTDGQPTAGITETNSLLEHIKSLIQQAESKVIVFSFGVGSDVNYQLLTLLSNQNNGVSTFLENSQLEEVITDFYLQIRNPVLLNSKISYADSTTIKEVFPDPLPNLYKGSQMIVSGRYTQPSTTSISLKGEAFGAPVEYQYQLSLADSEATQYKFLPKVWAKEKIEHLLVEYYSLSHGDPMADTIKNQIVKLSTDYGVITPFTSFTGSATSVEEHEQTKKDVANPKEFKILGNYPNPFNPSTTIRFYSPADLHSLVSIKIYNTLGQLIKTLFVSVDNQGYYEVRWNGLMENGLAASSGTYIYTIDFGNVIMASKMILLK